MNHTTSDMESTSLVTVILTCYNYDRYVESAIRSVFAQDYGSIELVIINDGSTDNSQELIDRATSTPPPGVRVHVISHENRGLRTVRNEGRELATGEYHIFIDADDTWDTDFVSELVKVAHKTGADVVYPNWRVTEEGTGVTWVREFGPFSTEGLQLQDFDVCISSLVRTEAARGFTTHVDDAGEDWDFFNRLALSGRVFAHAPSAYLNYLTKPTGNNRQTSYVDNVLKYETLLASWRTEFGADQVIAPGRLQEKLFRNLEAAHAHERARADDAEVRLRSSEEGLALLRAEVTAVRSSVTFRVGSTLVRPVRRAVDWVRSASTWLQRRT